MIYLLHERETNGKRRHDERMPLKDWSNMERYKVNTPEGTRDRLFTECAERRHAQNAMTSLFEKRGYSEVITPEVEYYDLFVKAQNPLPQEAMLKLVDREGRLLVLRPDCTTPIARVAATRLKDAVFPQRLYYNQNIFRVSGSDTGSDSDIPQCGIELIGAPGLRGDIEAVAMAIDALCAAGAGNFHIELGHVNFFTGLATGLEIDQDRREALKSCIESRNFALLEDMIRDLNGSEADCLRKLPYMFGGAEVLDEALTLTDNREARAAVDYLRAIYRELEAAGRGGYVRFDLGLVQSIDYYSGLVYRGFLEGAGSVVLAGGRYDNLIGDFGLSLPSTGFAVYVDSLIACLPAISPKPLDTLVYYEEGLLDSALKVLDSLSKGSAELSPCSDFEDTMMLARKKGVQRICAVGRNGVTEVNPNAKS
jgi:ATP phosphoribosyltransferase regulatory subunit